MSPIKRVFKVVILTIALQLPFVAHALDAGSAAPDFSLTEIDGSTIALSSLKGKVVYLDFWASWCGPCKHTLPWMNELQNKYASQGFQVLTVNLDANAEKAKNALVEIHPSFIVALDPEKSVVDKYAPPKMPTSFLINKEGEVVMVHPGFNEGDQEEIETKIAELLG